MFCSKCVNSVYGFKVKIKNIIFIFYEYYFTLGVKWRGPTDSSTTSTVLNDDSQFDRLVGHVFI